VNGGSGPRDRRKVRTLWMTRGSRPAPAHRNTLQACLARAQERGYREAISQALFEHVTASGGLALCLQA